MSRCPLCGGRVLYQGFSFLECATAECANGRAAEAVAPGPAAALNGRQLIHFAMALSVGQHWTEVSTGKLFELTAVGSNTVDLDSCFGPSGGQWIKRSVSIYELADPGKWQHFPTQGPRPWSPGPFWPGSSNQRQGRPYGRSPPLSCRCRRPARWAPRAPASRRAPSDRGGCPRSS